MKDFKTEDIRNVALVGHGSTGKTSLAEAMLFSSGAINRLGKVEDGTTTSDYDPDEIKRKISINLSLLPCEWKGKKINLIDTPGYADFVGEMKAGATRRRRRGRRRLRRFGRGGRHRALLGLRRRALPAADGRRQPDGPRERRLLRRPSASFSRSSARSALALQMPIGAQSAFRGVVDLLALKSLSGREGDARATCPTRCPTRWRATASNWWRRRGDGRRADQQVPRGRGAEPARS